jgi:hydrogenase maturation protease
MTGSIRTRTLVVGIGSPHGDDGIGWLAAKRLKSLLPPQAWVVTPRVPLDLLADLQPDGRCIVLDAVDAGSPRGQIFHVEWRANPNQKSFPSFPHPVRSSTHDWGLAATLELAAALGRCPETVVLFGIECGPESIPQPQQPSAMELVSGEALRIPPDLDQPLQVLVQQVFQLWTLWEQPSAKLHDGTPFSHDTGAQSV